MASATRASDIRVLEAQPFFSHERPRAAFSFGNAVAGDLTLCHVRVRVENRRGRVSDGWGAIFLSHPWAFPTTEVEASTKDQLMRRVVERVCKRVADHQAYAHPIDIFHELQGELETLATQASRELAVTASLPALADLVCVAAVDAALHDGFGRVNGICTYDGYGAEHCASDLSKYLGSEFRGRYVGDFLRKTPMRCVPVSHTVGGLDPLRANEVALGAPGDGLPQALDQWISRDGLRAFKVKLHGADIARDLDRLIAVHRVAQGVLDDLSKEIHLSVDLNEQCPSSDYPLEYLRRLRESEPGTFNSLRYIEQPTPRNLDATSVDVTPVAALKPVVLDEGLTSLGALERSRALGWTGIALKTCKCQSLMLLALACASDAGLMMTVQDLSNPGLALIQSVGTAARLPTPSPMEANARQYYPDASVPESAVHPGINQTRDGVVCTETLRGDGFGYQIERIDRPIFRPELPG